VPRKKQGRNKKWRRLCEIFRVNRRFNDVLYQIEYSPRAKPILAHVDKLRRCESELPKRWKDHHEISSGIASQSDQPAFTRHASPTTGPNTGCMPNPTVSPTVVHVTCPTTSPKETDAAFHRLHDQTERKQDVTTVKRSESELATRPGRPSRARRTPDNVTSALVNDKSFGNSRFVVPAYLNGKYVTCYRDSGANLSVCRKLLIPASAYTGESVDISGVTGKQQRVALAKLWLRSPLFGSRDDALIIVGCLDDLPYDLLLGNSFFELNIHLRDVIMVQSDPIDDPAQPKAVDVDRAKSLNERNILSVVTRQQVRDIYGKQTSYDVH
jgi:hypothetical protein